MKSVEQGMQERMNRRLPMWTFLGALACVAVGAFVTLHVPARRESARAQPPLATSDPSLEINRLKQELTMLERRSAALAVAVSSAERGVAPRPRDNEAQQVSAEVKDTRSTAEIQHAEITALQVRFASEQDGSRESLVAAQTMQAELRAAPLGAARIKEVACSTSLCRATLEQDANAEPMNMTALIESTPSVRRESMFDYDEDGSTKRVTIYSAREGHKLMESPTTDTTPTRAN